MGVIIAGGGIGGLVLALSLHQRSIPCTVFEAAPDPGELGVGINLLPHAVTELAELGLRPELEATGVRTRELRYLNRFGQRIRTEPRGEWAGHPVPQFSIHRGRLHGLLWRAARERLGPDSLRTGHRVGGFVQDDDGVTVEFAGATRFRGDGLVGADGIHSAVRAALHPGVGGPNGVRWNGVQMWRGAVEWPVFEGGDTMVICGSAMFKVVVYPIAPGSGPGTRLTNWVVTAPLGDPHRPPPRREDWAREGRPEDPLALVERLEVPWLDLAAMIRATPTLWEFPMCDRDPLPWWTRGRVTLLGDAAHPMYPAGSNGAAQAIVDARCLAAALTDRPVPQALLDYQERRRAATEAVVLANRRGGPERMLDLVDERAPDGFDDIDDVASSAELDDIARGYARISTGARGR